MMLPNGWMPIKEAPIMEDILVCGSDLSGIKGKVKIIKIFNFDPKDLPDGFPKLHGYKYWQPLPKPIVSEETV